MLAASEARESFTEPDFYSFTIEVALTSRSLDARGRFVRVADRAVFLR